MILFENRANLLFRYRSGNRSKKGKKRINACWLQLGFMFLLLLKQVMSQVTYPVEVNGYSGDTQM